MNKTDEHSTIRQELGGLWRVCQGYIEVSGQAMTTVQTQNKNDENEFKNKRPDNRV